MARVEGRTAELSQAVFDLRAAMRRLEQRMDRLEERMGAGFDALENKMSRQFMWIVGIQTTTLLAIVTMLGAVVVTVVSRA